MDPRIFLEWRSLRLRERLSDLPRVAQLGRGWGQDLNPCRLAQNLEYITWSCARRQIRTNVSSGGCWMWSCPPAPHTAWRRLALGPSGPPWAPPDRWPPASPPGGAVVPCEPLYVFALQLLPVGPFLPPSAWHCPSRSRTLAAHPFPGKAVTHGKLQTKRLRARLPPGKQTLLPSPLFPFLSKGPIGQRWVGWDLSSIEKTPRFLPSPKCHHT